MQLLTFITLVSMLFIGVFGANEEDNPVAFLMFEHPELSRETFLKEQKLVTMLKKVRQSLQTKRKEIQTFLGQVRGRGLAQTESNAHDAITSLALLKRSALVLPKFKTLFRNELSSSKGWTNFVNETTAEFPTLDDFNGAVKGLVMLHETYELHLPAASQGQLLYRSSQGLIKEFPCPEKLELEDLVLLSEKAKSQLLYDVSIEFLQAAILLAEKVKITSSMKKRMDMLRKNLVHLNNQHLIKWEKMIGTNYKVLPYLVDKKLNPKVNQPPDLMEKVHRIEIRNDYQTDYCFKQVCRNAAFTRLPDRMNLPKCGYLHHFDPYLRLGPFKVEVAFRSPYLSVLHDLLTEKEIQWMIDYSTPRLSRVRGNMGLITPKHEKFDTKKRKTIHKTVQCWIKDIEYEPYNQDNDLYNYTVNFPLMFKLAQKIELATQMNVTGKYSSTDFQTTNYGLGGLCEKHIDPHGYIEGAEAKGPHKSLIQSGDMIGTVMAWLGEVEGGGATAFLHHHVERALMPTRGSVAFWYDLDRKGYRDKRSLHGGCPVIKGSKWILNKWIYYFNQSKNFPCGLHPQEYFPPPKGHYKNVLKL